MIKLKGFICQWEKPKGTMTKGYIVYKFFYYAIQYIKKLNHTQGVVIWNDECDEDKRDDELLQINGKRSIIKGK